MNLIRFFLYTKSLRSILTCSVSGLSALGSNCKIIKSKFFRNVSIAECSNIFGSIVAGDVTIGRFTNLSGPGILISSRINQINIGSFCSIASNVKILEYSHNLRRVTTHYLSPSIFKENIDNDSISKGSINIGDDVWIGTGVVILSGVTIGTGAVIGANSVVTKDIEPYSICAGVPCKIIGMRFNKSDILELLESKWWSWSIEKIRMNKNFFTKDYL